MRGINNNRGCLSAGSLQANQQRQTSSIEQNRTNSQSAAVATNTQSPPPVAAAAPLAAAVAQDAALRQQLIPVGVEESKGFGILPQDVVVDVVRPFLDNQSVDRVYQTSRKLCNYVQTADEVAEKQLPSLREELKQLIATSGITGIQIPERSKHIHALRVLTAFKDNLPNAISFLKQKSITDINEPDEYGRTPLHLAAQEGRTETVLFLIAAGAKVNAKSQNGRTPLHWAAENDHKETVQALIDFGAEVNLADNSGDTPLHWAAYKGCTETLEALLNAGANMDARDGNGYTPLHVAAQKGRTKTVLALIAAGADLNARDQDGVTPLHLAAYKGHTETLEALLNAGANVNAKDNEGLTPLLLADIFCEREIVLALIAKGADVSTYAGENELVLNIEKIENGDVIDSDVDVDLDLLTHRFMAIVKQKAMLKMKSGGHSVPPLEDMCFKTVTDYLENWGMFIEFVNGGWDVLPNVQEVTTMRLFQYLKKHSQSASAGEEGAAAASGGVEESKGNTHHSHNTGKAQDAALRQQLIPVGAPTITHSTSAAIGVKGIFIFLPALFILYNLFNILSHYESSKSEL